MAFTFAQNWPRGSALCVLLIVLAGAAVFLALRRIDLDRIIGQALMTGLTFSPLTRPARRLISARSCW